jgi:hypothetical protein
LIVLQKLGISQQPEKAIARKITVKTKEMLRFLLKKVKKIKNGHLAQSLSVNNILLKFDDKLSRQIREKLSFSIA